MNLDLNRKKSLFVAYPWNIYIQSMYEDIFHRLFESWDIRHGSNVTLKDKVESEVEKFMSRNKHLYDVFVSAIEKCDFFIADVTGTNPNVMLELGVAIQLNKNVLIVTSDELKKLPFDISGFRVSHYKSKEALIKIIEEELNIFSKIKSQTFVKYFDGFYFNFPAAGELRHNQLLPFPVPKNLKNLRLRIEYKFLSDSNSHDWLGIHLRAQLPDIVRSELVYVRSNSKLESVSFPGRRAPEVGKTIINKQAEMADGFKLLELVIEENSLKALTDSAELEDNKIQTDSTGGVVLHAFAHNPPTQQNLVISYKNLEILSLDTTAPV